MRQRVFVVLDIEHNEGGDYWRAGLPDFIQIALNDASGIMVHDLTVYPNLEDLLKDREEGLDMFRYTPTN